MADYAFRTIAAREKIEKMWNDGTAPKKIAEQMNVSETVIYKELKRGNDGTNLADGRKKYSALTAQRVINHSLARRGRKAASAE